MTGPTRAQRLGAVGEELAARWYRDAGYLILDRNWRSSTGELDVVASLGGTIVFCEVKTRSSERFGTAAEAVDGRKQRKVRAVAREWLRHTSVRYDCVRFDVASVDLSGRLEIYQGCF